MLSEGQRNFTVELKGVNHRYLDVNIRMPKKLNFFDASIRSLLKQYAQRGKVDIFITYEDMSENQVALKYDAALAEEVSCSILSRWKRHFHWRMIFVFLPCRVAGNA